MSAAKGPEVTIRFLTKARYARMKEAAKLRYWSINTFVIAACDQLADRILSPAVTTDSVEKENTWKEQAMAE